MLLCCFCFEGIPRRGRVSAQISLINSFCHSRNNRVNNASSNLRSGVWDLNCQNFRDNNWKLIMQALEDNCGRILSSSKECVIIIFKASSSKRIYEDQLRNRSDHKQQP